MFPNSSSESLFSWMFRKGCSVLFIGVSRCLASSLNNPWTTMDHPYISWARSHFQLVDLHALCLDVPLRHVETRHDCREKRCKTSVKPCSLSQRCSNQCRRFSADFTGQIETFQSPTCINSAASSSNCVINLENMKRLACSKICIAK